MSSRIRIKTLALLTCCISTYAIVPALGSETVGRDVSVERSLLENFAKKMRSGYNRANVFLQDAGIEKKALNLRGLPDGEILVLDIILPNRIKIEGDILGQIHQQQIYLSLRDVIGILDFPIEFDAQTQNFSGWYIREDRVFNLDRASGIVNSGGSQFNIGSNILVQDDELYFPLSSYENWFNLTLEPDISTQVVKLDATPPLPIMERYARRQFQGRSDNAKKPVSLPRADDGYGLLSFPQIDVNTRTDYRRPDIGDSTLRRNLNVRTAGEFAYGTLATNLSANDEDQLVSARVKYMRESGDPELLGKLKARSFEVGDIEPTRLPITGGSSPETGVRITNFNPLARQTLPSTQISGYIFPGWDVELYRENSLIAFSETDDSGYYSFDNVSLFSSRNFFRVVAYGPQGEVREESVNVPYDTDRQAEDSAIYDVSLSFQNRNFYNKFDSTDEDKGTPHFVGFLETPLTDTAVLRLGARHRDEDGDAKTYVSTGVSASYAGALLTADIATDEQGEIGSEFVATRRFGLHNFRTDLDLATDNYNPGGERNVVQTLSNRYSLEGPFPLGIGQRPRYSTSFNYAENAEGDANYFGRANFNTTYNNFGFNQTFNYNDGDNFNDALVTTQSSVTGTRGRDTYRGAANYNISPDAGLDELFASWRRRISPELESQLELGYTLDEDVRRIAGQLDWRPDTVTITPRFSYDSEGNAAATLSTRFGVTRNPDSGQFHFSKDFVTSNGTVNVFVYLDKDGNGVFDGEDEPIQDATVLAPQNGGRATTDEDGIAFLTSLRPNVITDVYVEPASLQDPFWIPGAEGASIMPRTGTNVSLEIPIHNSGEIDGTVYAKLPQGGSKPLRRVALNLHSEDGKIEQTTKAGPDGFYLFSLVPPGRYALSIADAGLPADMRRPRPEFIEIGYDGTMIFGKDIFVEAGKPDIPTDIIADLDDYKALHPHIDFSSADFKIALNLGQYKSRLMTSFMWYRLKSRYGQILAGTQIYVPPSQSYALPKTGEHVLRVGLQSEDIDDAYNRCRALVARGLYCKVEIYPTAKKQKFAAVVE